jgi:hypothetical protein
VAATRGGNAARNRLTRLRCFRAKEERSYLAFRLSTVRWFARAWRRRTGAASGPRCFRAEEGGLVVPRHASDRRLHVPPVRTSQIDAIRNSSLADLASTVAKRRAFEPYLMVSGALPEAASGNQSAGLAADEVGGSQIWFVASIAF